jgi:hypothetical protein
VNPPVGGPFSVVWSVSNATLATLSNQTSSGVTVNSLSTQGNVTLTANITNACGQTATKTKIIKIGNSIPSFNAVKSTEYVEICGNDFHYVFVDITNPDTSGSTYTYTFNGFVTGIASPNVTYGKISETRYMFKIPKNKITTGPNPVFTFNVTCTNVCGSSSSIYGKTITLDAAKVANCMSGTPVLPPVIGGMISASSIGISAMSKESGSALQLFEVYPNPASDILTIALKDSEEKAEYALAELYDMMGQKRITAKIENNEAVINVRELPKGIYVLKIIVNGVAETHQVAVK